MCVTVVKAGNLIDFVRARLPVGGFYSEEKRFLILENEVSVYMTYKSRQGAGKICSHSSTGDTKKDDNIMTHPVL